MTRILGIDIHPRSILEVRYAAALVDTLNNETQIFESLSVAEVIECFSSTTIDGVAVDHINELRVDPRILEYLVDAPQIQVFQLSLDQAGTAKSISQIAREYGISIRGRPNPIKTAMICALLTESSGRPVSLTRRNGRIEYVIGEYSTKQSQQSILSKSVRDNQKEYTHREVKSIIENSPYVKSIDQVIGFGKEAITYRITDVLNRDTVIKVFRTYTPVARSIYHKTYKARQAHIPLLMARTEQLYLKLLADEGIPVPKFYFRDDAIVGMEAILDGDRDIAPTLAELQYKEEFSHSRVEDIFYQALEYLYNLFDQSQVVHGDYSANNLLITDERLYVIDLSQAKRVNINTFTSTPLRLRMDEALDVLFRDLHGILVFFEKEFRIEIERAKIFSEFLKLIPDFFRIKVHFVLTKWEQKFR